MAATITASSAASRDRRGSTSRRDPTRSAALVAGLAYIATFVFSIPARGLFAEILDDPEWVLGAGSTGPVLWGSLFEILTAVFGIVTAVAVYPVIRRWGPSGAIGFVSSRAYEAAMIVVGIVSLLAVVTLREDVTGTTGADAAALVTVSQGLVAVKEWTFLAGPGVAPVLNALFFASVLRRSGLVPRLIPTLGLVGAPLLALSSTATLFGIWDQWSTPAGLLVLPLAAWELSVGVWMAVKGFRSVAEPAPS